MKAGTSALLPETVVLHLDAWLKFNQQALESAYWSQRTHGILLTLDYQFNLISTLFWAYFMYRSGIGSRCTAPHSSGYECAAAWLAVATLALVAWTHHWMISYHKEWYMTHRGRLVVMIKISKLLVLSMVRELTPVDAFSKYIAGGHTRWSLPKLMLASGVWNQVTLTVFYQGPLRQQLVAVVVGFSLFLRSTSKITSACLTSAACTSTMLRFHDIMSGLFAKLMEVITGLPIGGQIWDELLEGVDIQQQVCRSVLYIFLSFGVVVPALTAYLIEWSTKLAFARKHRLTQMELNKEEVLLGFKVPCWSYGLVVSSWVMLSLLLAWVALLAATPSGSSWA